MSFKKFQLKPYHLIGLIAIPLLLAACSGPDITEIDWQWREMAETEPASLSLVPDPENYTLRLLPDGTVEVTADCNEVAGTYELKGSDLSFEFGPATTAYCGDESLDQFFLGFLGLVDSFEVEDDQLILLLKDDAGHMTFEQ